MLLIGCGGGDFEKEFSDERITVRLENVEITNDLPAEIEIAENFEILAPDDGYTHVFVQLNIVQIEGVHLTNVVGYGDVISKLIDTTGQEYEFSSWSFRGVKLTDPTDVNSASEFIEGAEGFLVFEVPSNVEPSSLVLIYSYKESMDEESPTKSEINILIEE
jgi:hypothetical protein